ncbi:hypothetical protein KBD59_00980 [Candidatus Gracilibacteria bacterium]|nr:hypothetical protein [Candidatus Gracilibacteria bacterium]
MRFLVGIIGFPLGIVFVVYREKIKRFTGEFAAFEKWFGPGGTYTGLIIVGLGISILSLMYALGTLQSLGQSLLGPFFQ